MKYLRTPRNVFFGAVGLLALAGTAIAEDAQISIPAQDLKNALQAYIRQSGAQVLYNLDDVTGVVSRPVHGVSGDAALARMLHGTGLSATHDRSGAVIVSRLSVESLPRSGPSTGTEKVIVTGSRIRNPGELSTPVLVLDAERLRASSTGSISEALDKLPIFMGGATPNNATTGANGGGNNIPGYFLNLRNLGAIRTLVLTDGHRVPGTIFNTIVDSQVLPQLLVQRVEVVTGGASAVYGSDAVTGVVNFILDHKFEGLKGILQGGISGYGDARSFRAGVAGGHDLFGGHLVWSFEYTDRDALPDAAARPLGSLGYSVVGAGTVASPYYLVRNIRQANTAPGGLITSSNSPGYGMQFNSAGQVAPFNPGTPTVTTNFNIGGDGGIEHNEYLLPVANTAQIFGYYTHKFAEGMTAWTEIRYAMGRTFEAGQIFTNTSGGNTLTGSCAPVNGVCTGNPKVNFTNNGAGAQYPITIYSGNAFLTPASQAFLFPTAPASCLPGSAYTPTTSTTSCPSFMMNRMDNDLMSRLGLTQHTSAIQLSAGLKGALLDKYYWDFTYGHGENRHQLTSRGNVNSSRFFAAIDAIKDPSTGKIVCNASVTSPGAFPGCVPLNLFGQSSTVINGSNASNDAIKWIGDPPTYLIAHSGLDDFSANINGTIFDGWAGPVKAAVGVEYRLASLVVETTTPDNTFNPQYLRLAPVGTFANASANGTYPISNLSRFKEVQSGARGAEDISEANLELEMPLLQDLPGLQHLSVNAAGRYTEYHVSGLDPASTSGGKKEAVFSASTWKIGAEWQVIDDLKFRATRSRDIRAPTLWELFQGSLTSTSGKLDPLTGVSGSVNTLYKGNPTLKPEVAHTSTVGTVLTPNFLSGFSATVDYFHIVIDDQIAKVSGGSQTVLNVCLNSGGTSPLCNLIIRPGAYNDPSPANFPTLHLSVPQNTQTNWTEGFDLELNYKTGLLQRYGLKGTLDLNVMWTHTSLEKFALSLPGSVVTDMAGAASAPDAALPRDKAILTLSYGLNGLNINLQERYYSPVRQDANPTLAFNIPNIPAYFITDFDIAYGFNVWQLPFTSFLHIDNLLDRKPDVLQVPSYTGSPGMNYPTVPYEDLIGRYFTVGLRFKT